MRRLFVLLILLTGLLPAAPDGLAIYQKHCAECHGDNGQGVDNEYDEPLVGDRSIKALARYIDETMPEFAEHLVVGEDALAVSEYIHQAFYSPDAQERNNPVRQTLLRRTQQQHRNSIADLIGSFRDPIGFVGEQGLTAYTIVRRKRSRTSLPLRRATVPYLDAEVMASIEGLNPDGFRMNWEGSLTPPETGTYQIKLRTPNGAKISINQAGSGTPALIDLSVSSNNQMREETASVYLLGNYPVPISVSFRTFQEQERSLTLEWKPPHGAWEPIPDRYFSLISVPNVAVVDTKFPPDDASLGYERGGSVSKAWNEAIAKAAIQSAKLVMRDLRNLAGIGEDDDEPTRVQKLREFCIEFTSRAFGRPLTPEQKKLYVQNLFTQHTPEEAVKRNAMLTLTSPYFLYPSLNQANDSYGMASHLALSLWDSIPDQVLREATSAGELQNFEGLKKQITRMVKDRRTQQKVQRFYFQWLALSEKENLTKDPETYPNFSERHVADLRSSFTTFLHQVTWSNESDYRLLFSERELFLNPRLAEFYQAQHPGGSGFERIPVPDKQRSGIFTHPYLLTAYSYHKQTSPIHRGVYIGRNVLGRYLKPPPNAIEFKDSDFNPHLTMREKVTELTKAPSCMACHAIINPVGFSLENFDAVGRFRSHEKNKPIDVTSIYPTEDDRTIPINGPSDLARIAINSPTAHRSFIKHLFHHLVHQPVLAYGSETMDQLHSDFTKGDFHIQNLISQIALITAPLPANFETAQN